MKNNEFSLKSNENLLDKAPALEDPDELKVSEGERLRVPLLFSKCR